jgi:hypothetical protein
MMTTRCNACLQDVSDDQIADPATHNTGGDTICLRCHCEATGSPMRTYIRRSNGDCWSGEEWINLNFALGARDACDFESYEAAAGYLDAALESDDSDDFADARVVTVEDQGITDDQIERLAAEAAEAGDIMGSAIACRAIGRDYSEHDLTPDELARVESMTTDECRLRCEQQIAGNAGRNING